MQKGNGSHACSNKVRKEHSFGRSMWHGEVSKKCRPSSGNRAGVHSPRSSPAMQQGLLSSPGATGTSPLPVIAIRSALSAESCLQIDHGGANSKWVGVGTPVMP